MMPPPLDPFALSFDSIDVDPTRAPTPEAIERAMAHFAPSADPELLAATAAAPDIETPGFYLIDDCGGRFIVDRDMGVVSLADEAILADQRGAIHVVRMRVVETSGRHYEIDLRLKLTGRIPQVDGREDFFAPNTEATVEAAPHAIAEPRATIIVFPTPQPPPCPARVAPWATHAVVFGEGQIAAIDEAASFGAALDAAPLPAGYGPARLHLFTPLPQPAPKTAAWSL